MKNKSLGKGLGALFEQIEEVNKDEIELLNVTEIMPNPEQVRVDFDEDLIEELASSIKKHGLLEPILVTKHGNKYMIVAGERRYRAFLKNGEEKIPAIVKNFKPEEIKKLSLIENIQRENLNPIEEAMSYKELMDELDMTQQEFAKEIGKSRSHVANSVRLLTLHPDVKNLVREGKISFGHAKILSSLDHKKQLELAKKIVEFGLTVRETENESKKKLVKPKKNPLYQELEESLQEKLTTRVRIEDKKGKGEIRISYFSTEELTRLIEILERL
ncbi:MAG: ParB/RepB/Spo0J family partition protein [Ezakiella sp.]|nr:ParB/RepB/Spo0J family partition protein [Ezakiella sp.]MDD7471720.1 ParB/RepB/Spo0J family partition protein [Bacillota bacterium]MDY3922950.1 ParB/RepB/Spo0J family partition protein [Ezakiella sp.]